MIKKYICCFKKNNKVKTLTFQITHNLLTEAWSKTIESSLAQGHNKIAGFQNLFVPEASVESITEPISKILTILEKYNPSFSNCWPPKHISIISALHELHYKFQLTQESEIPSLTISEEYDYNLNLLNAKVHEVESILANLSNYAVWFINQSPNSSIEITDELRKFWGVSLVRYNPARCLYLGYHTTGKDLRTCFVDNDTEVVRAGGVRQQQYISTETIFRINSSRYMNNKFAIKKWLNENRLESVVDLTDPKYKYNQQIPVLGKLSDKLTDDQIIELWRDWEFFKVDAE